MTGACGSRATDIPEPCLFARSARGLGVVAPAGLRPVAARAPARGRGGGASGAGLPVARPAERIAEGRPVALEQPTQQLATRSLRQWLDEAGDQAARQRVQQAIAPLRRLLLEVVGELALERAPDLL